MSYPCRTHVIPVVLYYNFSKITRVTMLYPCPYPYQCPCTWFLDYKSKCLTTYLLQTDVFVCGDSLWISI